MNERLQHNARHLQHHPPIRHPLACRWLLSLRGSYTASGRRPQSESLQAEFQARLKPVAGWADGLSYLGVKCYPSVQAKALPASNFLPKNCQNRRGLTIYSPSRIIDGDYHNAWNVAIPRGLLFVQVLVVGGWCNEHVER